MMEFKIGKAHGAKRCHECRSLKQALAIFEFVLETVIAIQTDSNDRYCNRNVLNYKNFRSLPILDFSERMASADENLFEDEKLVIISSTREIDMTQWRNHLIANWDKVFFLLLPPPTSKISKRWTFYNQTVWNGSSSSFQNFTQNSDSVRHYYFCL